MTPGPAPLKVEEPRNGKKKVRVVTWLLRGFWKGAVLPLHPFLDQTLRNLTVPLLGSESDVSVANPLGLGYLTLPDEPPSAMV